MTAATPTSSLPRITIVTPSYQQSRYLERTIRSVLDQNYVNLEYIVLDGGSTDGSVEIIKKYAERIDFWISEKDGGQSAAINRGLKMATGEVVGWLNSDDTFAPGALHRIAKRYQGDRELDLLYGHTCLIDSEDRVIRRLVSIPTTGYEVRYFCRDLWSQPGTTWRRRVHDKVGYLDESLHFLMDGDFWIRASQVAKLRCIPYHLANLRIHGQTKTSNIQANQLADAELQHRHGEVIKTGWRARQFWIRRKLRILRDPRNWIHRLTS